MDDPAGEEPKADPIPDAIVLAQAEKALGSATRRVSDLLGVDCHACKRSDGASAVALVLLDKPVAAIETRGTTVHDALQRATAFLDRIADAVERKRAPRMPPASKPLVELPKTTMPTGGKVMRLGR